MLLTLIARVPARGTADFAAYEAAVLPLLPRHGGELQKRLRHVHDDGDWTEIHVIAFADPSDLAAYRADPERARHAELLARSEANMTLLTVEEV
ncbi:MAG: hypothetical protein ACXVEF_20350 [Polyangiales bacterium]